MNQFECYCRCDNDECARFHKPPRPPCNCIRQISKSTKFIERILDCTETIVRVLSICGIHQCKAKAAADVIAFAFLHFDIVPDQVGDVLRKKLRKEDIFHDLGKKCRLNRVEAHLAYYIIKRAFKAFYYKQTADAYNPNFIDESQWMQATQKTAEAYALSEGLTENEKKKLEGRIKCAYCSFIQRVQETQKKEADKSCTCCFCRDSKGPCAEGFKVYANVLPKDDDDEYKFKKRFIEEGKLYGCASSDKCGKRILEWQTQIKSTSTDARYECTCGQGSCICPQKEVCGEAPHNAVATEEGGINVQWQPVAESQIK